MSKEEVLAKLKKDMEMRGLSHYTKEAYYRSTSMFCFIFNNFLLRQFPFVFGHLF